MTTPKTAPVSRDDLLIDPEIIGISMKAAKSIAIVESLDAVSAKEVYRTIIEAVIAGRLAAPTQCDVHTATDWQPIETAPHGKRVLLGWREWRDHQWCVEAGPATTGQRFGNGYSNLSQHGSATHWQPLPAEPSSPVPSADRGGK